MTVSILSTLAHNPIRNELEVCTHLLQGGFVKLLLGIPTLALVLVIDRSGRDITSPSSTVLHPDVWPYLSSSESSRCQHTIGLILLFAARHQPTPFAERFVRDYARPPLGGLSAMASFASSSYSPRAPILRVLIYDSEYSVMTCSSSVTRPQQSERSGSSMSPAKDRSPQGTRRSALSMYTVEPPATAYRSLAHSACTHRKSFKLSLLNVSLRYISFSTALIRQNLPTHCSVTAGTVVGSYDSDRPERPRLLFAYRLTQQSHLVQNAQHTN